MSLIKESDIKKGQAIYTPIMLKFYNFWVLDISNQWIWRCPKAKQLEQFNQFISSKHLDIGVGTGYYLESCKIPPQSEISLMDLNPNCLKEAKNALLKNKIHATTYQADIFKKQSALSGSFNSISMNYLLHCLPGSMQTKETCIGHAISMLSVGGTLFGATILGDKNLHTRTSEFLCNFYNKKGIFSNQEDFYEVLVEILNQHLVDVDVSIMGCVALFKGVKAT